MTTTLTLTPDAATASVLVQASTDADGMEITRADQNGVVAVRLLEGAGTGQQITVRDHEPALVGEVRYTCKTTTPTEVRRNTVQNDPGSRTSPGTAWFGGAAFTTSVVVDARFPSGSAWRAEMTSTQNQARRSALGTASTVPVQAGVLSTFSLYAACSVRRLYRLELRFYNQAGAQLQPDLYSNYVTVPENTVHRLKATVAPPAGAVRAYVAATTWNDSQYGDVGPQWAVGDVIWASSPLVEIGSELLPWFDGSTSGAEWTGTPNNSASVIRGIESVERVVRFDEAPARDVVALVQRPQWRAQGRDTVGASFERASKSTRHDPVGRPDPIYVIRRGGYRTGTVETFCDDLAQAEAFDELVAEGGVVFFRQAAALDGSRTLGDFYAVIERVQVAPTPENVVPRPWMVTLTVSEVRRPTGPLLGSALWTYEELAAVPATYATLPQSFATYADLAAGVRGDV